MLRVLLLCSVLLCSVWQLPGVVPWLQGVLQMLSPKKWSIRWREVHEMAVLDGFGRLSPKNGAILRRRVYLDDLGGEHVGC